MNIRRNKAKAIPVVCPICKVEYGERWVADDSPQIEHSQVCDNIFCVRKSRWAIRPEAERARDSRSAGVGSMFIRNGIVPGLSTFPCDKLAWDKSSYICGPVGTGKTWALSAIVCDALASGRTARFINWQYFQLEVRDTYKAAGKETELDILRRYTRPDVLCLDDLGAGKRIGGKESDAARVLLYMLIDKRYSEAGITHISSNMQPARLLETYDSRIARRIKEMAEVVVLTEVV